MGERDQRRIKANQIRRAVKRHTQVASRPASKRQSSRPTAKRRTRI